MINNLCLLTYIVLQISPSVSTIILSGRTQSFVGHGESVTLKIVRQNRPTKSSQVGVRVRVSHVGVKSLHSQIVKL
jgi:predicted thioesterase